VRYAASLLIAHTTVELAGNQNEQRSVAVVTLTEQVFAVTVLMLFVRHLKEKMAGLQNWHVSNS